MSNKKYIKRESPVVVGSIKNKVMSTDLIAERAKCDFSPDLGGGLWGLYQQDVYQKYKGAKALMEDNPELTNSHHFYDMTREEMMINGMKKFKAAWKVGKKQWFNEIDPESWHWSHEMLGQNCTVLTQSMFMMTLQSMCNDEQREKWIPLVRNMQIMGAYAQTEIGHGSNVAGLETTATFDPKTDEFIINTPTSTATKWWPGDLGFFCTHAIVFAKLMIGGNFYGVVPLIVQMRDLDTYMPLQGVQCGDMGPKLGYESKNNGWATYDNVRIPRTNLLMRFISVDREGTFSIEGDTRALYSTMMSIRVQLINFSGLALAKALTIALRYSVVRRQFKNTSGSRNETKLLDYQTQQMKLLPVMASCLGYFMLHPFMHENQMNLLADVKNGKFDNMDSMHHFSSGFKSLCTQTTYDGLLQIRQSLGGAGYTSWSGLPYLIDNFSPCVTYEGDNTVMMQQSARFIQKLYKKIKKGERLEGIFSYLNDFDTILNKITTMGEDLHFDNLAQIDEALKTLSIFCIEQTITKMKESNVSKQDLTNRVFGLDLVKMATVHIKYILIKVFRKRLSEFQCPKLRGHMTNFCSLLGITYLQEYSGLGYESGLFKKGSLEQINKALKDLLNKLRPQAIPIIELFDFSDAQLCSAIGNSYGDIYETHLEWAKTSRLNKNPGAIPTGFMDIVHPILQGKL